MYERLVKSDIAIYTVVNDQGPVTDYFADKLDTVLEDFLLSEHKEEEYDSPYGKYHIFNETDGNGDFHIICRFKYAGKYGGLIYTVKGGWKGSLL